MDPSDYVLHDFDPPEEEMLPEVLKTAVEAIKMFIIEDIEKAMSKFNGPVIDED
jgi:PTH1 family peptidyl-tRNA hydrolase